MAQPYVGEIRMFAGSFEPAGWMFCSGQLLSIAENETLFQLIGTTYGGDGQETFALPDLQGRVPIHMGASQSGASYIIGEKDGVESVILQTQQLPAHSHVLLGTTSPANDANPANNVLAQASTFDGYQLAFPPAQAMAPQAVGGDGGSQPHDNMQPFLCVSFNISLYGIFPSQT